MLVSPGTFWMALGRDASHLWAVRRTKGSESAVDCPETWSIEADGEPLGTGPITVQVLPEAILFEI